jgi:signal transduction histidine kinase
MLDTMRLGRREAPAARAAALEMIDREVLRLQHLTEGVLRFARGESKGEAPAPERLDVGEELERIVAEFEPLAAARGMRLSLESIPGVVVDAQPGAIRQAVVKLLDNAVKYGPGGQTIRVRVEPDGDAVAIVVEDEGPGVRAEERDRIWDPYQRGAAAADRAAGGSGIGLTVVRQIVASHGGSSGVRGRDDGAAGACFEVRFPRVAT